MMSKFLPFEEALAVARSLTLASKMEWNVWCKEGMRPAYLPAGPHTVYKEAGWQGWVHWLGSGNIKKPSKFAPFDQALTFAQSLGLAGKAEWHAWCKEGRRPPNVPSDPAQVYKDAGWQGWGHWLGTGNTKAATGCFLPFADALDVARSLNLANMREWKVWCKEGRRPPNVPADPPKTYKNAGWQGWGHWLGTGNTRNTTQSLPFAEALEVARSLNLANQFEWRTWCKEGMRPAYLPADPGQTYKSAGWQGWVH